MAKIEDGNIESFRPQKRNANRHKPRGMGALEASMRKHGYVAPMTAAADGELLDGSARLETVANVFDDDVLVVRHDGTKPVIMVRTDIPNASTDEARAISIFANRVAELNLDWDAAELFADLQSGIDLSSVFTQDELDAMLAGLVAPEPVEDPGPQIDKADELRQKWGVSLGQMWGMGQHRLICGDCTDKATVDRLMGGEKAEMVWTDPPYGVAVGDKNKFLNSIARSNRVEENLENDTLDEPELMGMLCASFDNALSVALDGGAWYVAAPAGPLHVLFGQVLKDRGIWRQTIQWVKNNATFSPMGVDYHWKSEPIFYGWKPGAGHRYYGGRQQTTVWEIDRPLKSPEHPTMKPVELVARAIENSSKVGEIVYDPFSGSGTAGIACESLGRQARMVEIAPGYAGVILERWATATNQTPVLIS